MITTSLLTHLTLDSTTCSLNLLLSFTSLHIHCALLFACPIVLVSFGVLHLFSYGDQLYYFSILYILPILYILLLTPIYKSTYALLVLRVWSSLVVQSIVIHQSMWLMFSLVPHPLRPSISPRSYSCKWLKYWFTRSNFVPCSLYGIAIMVWLSSLFFYSFHPTYDICSPLWKLLESWLTISWTVGDCRLPNHKIEGNPRSILAMG